WFDGDVNRARDALLLKSLIDAVDERSHANLQNRPWGALQLLTFAHPLAISGPSSERFNVGPFESAGYAETVFSTTVLRPDQSIGPAFRAVFDAGDWDRSVAINAPGQSGSPSSPHF